MIIDGLPVLVEFISEEADQEVIKKSEEWKSKHVRESQYFLQIVKRKDSKCCSPFRSSYLKVVKDRFLPAPISVKKCLCVNRWRKSRRQLNLIFPLNHQVSDLPKRFNFNV